jgi:hypothetical protein
MTTVRGGISWLSPEEAIRVIQDAQKTSTRFLGLDGAFLIDNATRPSMEDSWDYSGQPVADPYSHAIQFIRERASKGLHFEIVVGRLTGRDVGVG